MFTSIFSGFVVFTYLGYMAFETGADISEVVDEGPALVFYVYPAAIATLPAAPVWSVLFFLMFFNLGIDSSMGGMEAICTGISDDWHFLDRWFRSHKRLAIVFGVHLLGFLVSLVNCTQGGIYALVWLDLYAAGISLISVGFCEAIAISYFYGIDRFSDDLLRMTGRRPGLFWRIAWKFTMPLLCGSILIASFIGFPVPTYGSYRYASWSITLGWLFSISSVVLIPLFAIIQLWRQKGSTLREKMALAITPVADHEELIESDFRDVKRFHLEHWLKF